MKPRDNATLHNGILPNSKTDGHCMAIVTWSGKILDAGKVMPKNVASKEVNDGVKSSVPIQIVVDKDLANEENMIIDEVKDDEPPGVVITVLYLFGV